MDNGADNLEDSADSSDNDNLDSDYDDDGVDQDTQDDVNNPNSGEPKSDRPVNKDSGETTLDGSAKKSIRGPTPAQ